MGAMCSTQFRGASPSEGQEGVDVEALTFRKAGEYDCFHLIRTRQSFYKQTS